MLILFIILGILGLIGLGVLGIVLSTGTLRKIVIGFVGICGLMMIVGGCFIAYNQMQIKNLRKEYTVEGTDFFSSYSLIDETEKYYIIKRSGFLDSEKYAAPKEEVQLIKTIPFTNSVLLGFHQGTSVGIPMEAPLIEPENYYPMHNLKVIVTDYNTAGIETIISSAIVWFAGIIVLLVVAVIRKLKKEK